MRILWSNTNRNLRVIAANPKRVDCIRACLFVNLLVFAKRFESRCTIFVTALFEKRNFGEIRF